MAQAAAIEALRGESRVMLRPGLRWRLEPAVGAGGPAGGAGGPAAAGRVVLRVFDRTVTFPAWCADALRHVLGGAPGRVDEIPGFAVDDSLVLVRRLLREGICVPAPGSVPVDTT